MFKLKVGVLSDGWEWCVVQRDHKGLEQIVPPIPSIRQQDIRAMTPQFESDVLASASLDDSLMFLLKGSADKEFKTQGRKLGLAVVYAQELLLQ